jgi:hypothetical protein
LEGKLLFLMLECWMVGFESGGKILTVSLSSVGIAMSILVKTL